MRVSFYHETTHRPNTARPHCFFRGLSHVRQGEMHLLSTGCKGSAVHINGHSSVNIDQRRTDYNVMSSIFARISPPSPCLYQLPKYSSNFRRRASRPGTSPKESLLEDGSRAIWLLTPTEWFTKIGRDAALRLGETSPAARDSQEGSCKLALAGMELMPRAKDGVSRYHGRPSHHPQRMGPHVTSMARSRQVDPSNVTLHAGPQWQLFKNARS